MTGAVGSALVVLFWITVAAIAVVIVAGLFGWKWLKGYHLWRYPSALSMHQ